MTQSVQIGPLVLPQSLLVTKVAIGLGRYVGKRLGRTSGVDTEPMLFRMLLAGLVVARLAFVWQWRGPYLDAPLTILDIRDCGRDAKTGFVSACLYGLHRTRLDGALRKPVIAAAVCVGFFMLLGSLTLALSPSQRILLPVLTLSSMDGQPVLLAAFTGKPIVVNLWAA